jgi:hypothetical protein
MAAGTRSLVTSPAIDEHVSAAVRWSDVEAELHTSTAVHRRAVERLVKSAWILMLRWRPGAASGYCPLNLAPLAADAWFTGSLGRESTSTQVTIGFD